MLLRFHKIIKIELHYIDLNVIGVSLEGEAEASEAILKIRGIYK